MTLLRKKGRPGESSNIERASGLYQTFVQGRVAYDDFFGENRDIAGGILNTGSAGIGGVQVLRQFGIAEKTAEKLGTPGMLLGAGIDIYNAGKAYTGQGDKGAATDAALKTLAQAGEMRALIAVGGIGATSYLTALNTMDANETSLGAAKQRMDQIHADTQTYKGLQIALAEFARPANDPATGKPYSMDQVVHIVPATQDGKPVTRDGKPVMMMEVDPSKLDASAINPSTGKPYLTDLITRDTAVVKNGQTVTTPTIDFNDQSNQLKLKAAFDAKDADLAATMDKNLVFVFPVPGWGNAHLGWLGTDNLNGLLGNQEGDMRGLSEMSKDPAAFRRYTQAMVERKYFDVGRAELNHLTDAVQYTADPKEKTPEQTHDAVVLAMRAGAPVKNSIYKVEPATGNRAARFVGNDRSEPLPEAARQAYLADPQLNRIYEDVLYKRDAEGRPLHDAQNKLVVAEVRRWEIQDSNPRQAEQTMTASEQQQAYGALWQSEWRADAKDKAQTLHTQFTQTAQAYAAGDHKDSKGHVVTAEELGKKYADYFNQLKYMTQEASQLGFSKEDVKGFKAAMVDASSETLHKQFDQAAQAYATGDHKDSKGHVVTSAELVQKYEDYFSQLKNIEQHSSQLGLTREDVTGFMTAALKEFNQAYDPGMQAVKTANGGRTDNVVTASDNPAERARQQAKQASVVSNLPNQDAQGIQKPTAVVFRDDVIARGGPN